MVSLRQAAIRCAVSGCNCKPLACMLVQMCMVWVGGVRKEERQNSNACLACCGQDLWEGNFSRLGWQVGMEQ